MASYEVVHAAGVLLVTRREPRQFLLMKHADRWDLPKGHAEAGESAMQTALRETEEETGLAGEKISLDPGFRYRSTYPVSYRSAPGQRFEKRLTMFLGWVEHPVDLECSEHLGYQWFLWQPPHTIQGQAIDPLLSAVAEYWEANPPSL